jgi:hypothetical protein
LPISTTMKKLLILPAVLLAAGFALGACDDTDNSPANDPGPVTSVVPSTVPTDEATIVPDESGAPSESVKPTTTVVPSKVTADPSCGPEDDSCGDGTDEPNDGK